MTPFVVLEIIRLSLEIALQAIRSMPPEQQQAFWERHERRVEFFENLLKKVMD